MMKRKIDKDSVASDFRGNHERFVRVENFEVIVPLSPTSDPSTIQSDSSEERLSGKPRKKARVSLESGGFAVSETRGRTEVGPQVEHATAYVLFEEMISSALENTKIKNAAQNLFKTFSSLPLSLETLQDIQQKAKAVKETISNDERKKTTRSMRSSNNLVQEREYVKALLQSREESACEEEEKQLIRKILKNFERISSTDVDKVKYSLKLANRANFASVVANIMDTCFFGANKMVYACFPTEKVPTNPNTGKERSAKNTLKMFSNFLIGVDKANQLTRSEQARHREKAVSIRDEIQRNQKLIPKLKDVWGLKNETIDGLISGEISSVDISSDVDLIISKYVGYLFYYPRLDPGQMYEYEIDGVMSKWAVDEQEWSEVMSKDPKSKKTGKPPKYNQGTKPRNNDPEILYQLAGRHAIIVFKCFRGFDLLSTRARRNITSLFLENSVLNANGWKDEMVKASGASEKYVAMDVRHLSTKLSEVVHIT